MKALPYNNIKIEKVKRDLKNTRADWGKYSHMRHAVMALKLGETIKIGPFKDKKDARKARTNMINVGAAYDLKKKDNFRYIGIVELDDDGNYYIYIQKAKAIDRTL